MFTPQEFRDTAMLTINDRSQVSDLIVGIAIRIEVDAITATETHRADLSREIGKRQYDAVRNDMASPSRPGDNDEDKREHRNQ